MGRPANFEVVESSKERLVIRDIGPWDRHMTVTNDAEGVVRRVASLLAGRRLFYFDSEGQLDELVVRDGEFAHFKPGPRG